MIHHVVGLFTHPDQEWREIRGDAEESIGHMYFTHTLILAAIPAISAFIGTTRVGWSIGSLDMIHIDRKDGSRAFHKVVEQGKRLVGQGIWVIMFPEGTRIPRGEAGDYKTGATRLAIMTGAQVVPIAVTSAKCWPRKAFVKKPGTVDVSVGKPIDSKGRKHDELMAEVEFWIESEMRRLDPDAYGIEGRTIRL